MIAAFNEWMRRYIEEPDRFRREWETVGEFIQERGQGKPPSYGQVCAAYLQQLIAEIRLADGQPPTA
jgi:hypothetical protein